MLRIREYTYCAVDVVVSLRAAALAFAMILALPSTDEIYNGDLFKVVRSIIKATGKDLCAMILPERDPGDELLRILPSLHVYLSSLEALLRVSPTILPKGEWEALRLPVQQLAIIYNSLHQYVYIDSNGRNTDAYIDVISRLIRGQEVLPPPAIRRQTLTPDVLTPMTVQEPADSPKPPAKAKLRWPSRLRLGFYHSEDIPLRHAV